MIVVRIEMWPGGDQAKAYPLGFGVIANIGGTKTYGDYKWILTRKKQTPWKEGHVTHFPRARKSVWHLLKQILQDVA